MKMRRTVGSVRGCRRAALATKWHWLVTAGAFLAASPTTQEGWAVVHILDLFFLKDQHLWIWRSFLWPFWAALALLLLATIAWTPADPVLLDLSCNQLVFWQKLKGDFWRTLAHGLDTTAELPPERAPDVFYTKILWRNNSWNSKRNKTVLTIWTTLFCRPSLWTSWRLGHGLFLRFGSGCAWQDLCQARISHLTVWTCQTMRGEMFRFCQH